MFNLNKWVTTTNITLILLIFLTILITFIMWLKGLDAGWMQAIISVIAIFSAIIISNSQIETTKKEKNNEKIEDIKKFISIIEICIDRYSALIRNISSIPQEYSSEDEANISYHWKSIKISVDQIKQFDWLKYPDDLSILAVNTFIDTQTNFIDNTEYLAKSIHRTYERTNTMTKVIKVPKTVDDIVALYFIHNKDKSDDFVNQSFKIVFEHYNAARKSLWNGIIKVIH
ncbi:hypothetical protein DM558_00350 [Entomomonas moraniae]|uniref:DUF4760 domain-containing protein n=1 Tax=Entomomonas moraniae TaxID=2213226 RepID=A0A3S9XA81_9GAMM|nr:hypothetical protein [Entomomonas moraniae]AZS49320.1 hypothetical protein DM558_00350 [Entomomonas moraniae]